LVLCVVTQRIEDLGEGEVGKMPRDFLRADPEAPQLDDSTHRGAGAPDDRFPTEDALFPIHTGTRSQAIGTAGVLLILILAYPLALPEYQQQRSGLE
jgi:hypothetical protein